MSQKNRFNSMADEYDKFGPIIVPKYSEMQDCICKIIKEYQKGSIRIMDIGAGSGLLLEKLTNEFRGEYYWQDFSDDFLSLAQNRLNHKKITYVLSDYSNKNWKDKINCKFDVIVSSHAIHHIKNERKFELYSEIYSLLNPGGIFINSDEVRGESEATYLMNLNFWNKYVQTQIKEGKVSEKMKKVWLKYVERNITNFPDKNPKDIHFSLVKQLEFLKKIGFESVECFWKNYLWAVFGGIKPTIQA